MQSSFVHYGSKFEDFQKIDFSKVYHEGGIGGDYSIIPARCAEVLASSPLEIDQHLQFILCRSQAERKTLLHALGGDASKWADRIRASDDIQVFQKEYCYLEEVSISSRGVTFRIHPRQYEAPIQVQVEARYASNNEAVVKFGPAPLTAIPGNGSTQWIAESGNELNAGNYIVSIWLEGHLAYCAELSLEPAPF